MFEIDKQKFGAFVAGLRREKGYTQKELADRLFISWRRRLGFLRRRSASGRPAPAYRIRHCLCRSQNSWEFP